MRKKGWFKQQFLKASFAKSSQKTIIRQYGQCHDYGNTEGIGCTQNKLRHLRALRMKITIHRSVPIQNQSNKDPQCKRQYAQGIHGSAEAYIHGKTAQDFLY